MKKTIKEASAETGFSFEDGESRLQTTDKGTYKLINGTLFYMYDLGRWEVYAQIVELQ